MSDERIAIPIDLLTTRGHNIYLTPGIDGNSFVMPIPSTTRVLWAAKSDWDSLTKNDQVEFVNFYYDLLERAKKNQEDKAML